MALLKALVEAIDADIAATQSAADGVDENDPRRHLGASIIGRECARSTFYGWRWGTPVKFDGRMLRLFNRGHEEEHRFVRWLRRVGAHVETVDPSTVHELWWHPESGSYHITQADAADEQTLALCLDVSEDPLHVARAAAQGVDLPEPKQHSFVGYRKHCKGSMDAIVTNVPTLEPHGFSKQSRLIGEFKTHNDKSFRDLVKLGVMQSKPEHYVQANLYAHEKQADAILYGAVNKDNDELHMELLTLNHDLYMWTQERIRMLVDGNRIPVRPKYASPYSYQCKMCDYRRICVLHEPAWKNCRMCKHSTPVDDGRWHCGKWNALIPQEKEIEGCPAWVQLDNDG